MTKTKSKSAYYINSLVVVAIMAGSWLIPPQAPLTAFGIRTLGALLGAIYGILTVDMAWPNLLAIFSFAASGFVSGNAAMGLVGGNSTMLYILALFAFAGIFVSTNTAPVLAHKIVAWKIARNKPWMLSFVLLLACFIPAIVVGGVPAMLIAWNIVYAICEETGIQKGEKWPTVMIIMIAFVGSCGYSVLPIQVANAANLGYIAGIAPNLKINMVSFILVTVVYSVLSIGAFMFYLKFIIKPDVSKLVKYDNDKPAPKFNKQQLACLWLFFLMFVLLMLQSMIPSTALGKFMASLGNSAVVVLVLAIAFFIKIDGKHLAEFKDIAADITWTPVLMMAVALCLGGTFSDPKTGINAWLGKIVSPVFSGMNPIVLCVSVVVLSLLLAQFVRGNVSAWVFQPIIFSFNAALPKPLLIGTMVAIMCITPQAALLPSGSTNGALMHGNREWLAPKDLFKYITHVTIIVTITLIIATLGAGSLVF